MQTPAFVVLLLMGLALSFGAPALAEEPEDKGPFDVQSHFAGKARQLAEQAKAGDLKAMHELAFLQRMGLGTPRRLDQALIRYRRAAQGGYAPSMRDLGAMYWQGEGVEKNQGEALMWYRSAAEKGDVEAMEWLGDQYAWGKEMEHAPKTAFGWYQKAAEAGHVPSQRKLGQMYLKGEGVAADATSADHWLKRAAEGGDDKAMLLLALSGFEGLTQQETSDKAAMEARVKAHFTAERVGWFQRAAELGNVSAQGMMAQLHANGLGVERDYVEAATWAQLGMTGVALEALEEASQKQIQPLRDALFEQLSAEERAEVERRVQTWVDAHPKVRRVHTRLMKDGTVKTKVWGEGAP